MTSADPAAELAPQFSSENATATMWDDATERLEAAELYWVVTVRPDGRPHLTPLISVWLDGSLYFCTGASERKAKNLAENPRCIILTGCNALNEGLDVVVEGKATNIRDDAILERVAARYVAKYGAEWEFKVGNGEFQHEGGTALVFELTPSAAFGFGKGDPFSQTRFRF